MNFLNVAKRLRPKNHIQEEGNYPVSGNDPSLEATLSTVESLFKNNISTGT